MTGTVELSSEPAFMHQRATPCLAKLAAQRSWDSTLALRVGEQFVGVRANIPSTVSAIERLLGHLRVPELDAVAPPNLSVELAAGAHLGGARGLHLVYRDHEIVARRRDPDQLLLDLVALVESTRCEAETACLSVRGTAVVVAGEKALLLPWSWHRELLMHQARLTTEGLELLAPRNHLVDAKRTELVITARGSVTRSGRPPSVPLGMWGLQVAEEHPTGMRPAHGVQAAFLTVANVQAAGPRPTLEWLAHLARTIPFVGLPARSEGSELASVRRLARTESRGGGTHPASR